MISNKFRKDIIKNLNESEEYMYKVFLYLKELEKIKSHDKSLQETIWNLCEAGEINSNIAIELEVLETEK